MRDSANPARFNCSKIAQMENVFSQRMHAVGRARASQRRRNAASMQCVRATLEVVLLAQARAARLSKSAPFP
jgi:hypothetical protein